MSRSAHHMWRYLHTCANTCAHARGHVHHARPLVRVRHFCPDLLRYGRIWLVWNPHGLCCRFMIKAHLYHHCQVKWKPKWAPKGADGWCDGEVVAISDGRLKNPNGRGVVKEGFHVVKYTGRSLRWSLRITSADQQLAEERLR